MTGSGFCPVCGRWCQLTPTGQLTTHTDPRLRYGPACPGEFPAFPYKQVDR